MNRERLCNISGCATPMRPTREVYQPECYSFDSPHRIWRCPKCGQETPWVDNPVLNGTPSELHHLGNNDYSGLSISSDINFVSPLRRTRNGGLRHIQPARRNV